MYLAARKLLIVFHMQSTFLRRQKSSTHNTDCRQKANKSVYLKMVYLKINELIDVAPV